VALTFGTLTVLLALGAGCDPAVGRQGSSPDDHAMKGSIIENGGDGASLTLALP